MSFVSTVSSRLVRKSDVANWIGAESALSITTSFVFYTHIGSFKRYLVFNDLQFNKCSQVFLCSYTLYMMHGQDITHQPSTSTHQPVI